MKLSDIKINDYSELPISDSMLWLKSLIRRLVRGGIYLISGEPGAGKSTLSIQLGIDLAVQNIPSMFLLTEQHASDLALRANKIIIEHPDQDLIQKNIKVMDSASGIKDLYKLLFSQVLNPAGTYFGTKLIVVDSVQGQGLSSSSTSSYEVLYQFARECKRAGITVLLIAHLTKDGKIGGPRTLEHNVDCSLLLRRAPGCTAAIVLKNRFAATPKNYLALTWNRYSALQLSPHSIAATSTVFGFNSNGIVEIQFSIELTHYGSKGKIDSIGIPYNELNQIITVINKNLGRSIFPSEYVIQCRIPQAKGYGLSLGLSIVIGLIGAHLRKPVPQDVLYIGEVDLYGKCRPINAALIEKLGILLSERTDLAICCTADVACRIIEQSPETKVAVVNTLRDAVDMTWPDALR